MITLFHCTQPKLWQRFIENKHTSYITQHVTETRKDFKQY